MKLAREKNGIFYAKWSENRRSKRASMGTSDPAEAKRRFAEWLLDQGRAPLEKLTVGDCWRIYDAKHVEHLASPETARFSWRALEPHFAHLAVEDVTRAVEAYVAQRTKTVKPSTVRRELTALRACLSWCADGRKRKPLIAAVPALDMPEEGEARDRWLSRDEVFRMGLAAEACGEEARLFFLLALETAGRKQALLDLTWDRVDLETKVVHLRDPAQRETKKRRASVPISTALLPVLRLTVRKGPRVFSPGFDPYRAVLRIAKRAGVEGVTPHVLRHTAASHMARRGVPLWQIAKVLGNSIAMVEKVYAKHSPDDLRAAVDMISGQPNQAPMSENSA